MTYYCLTLDIEVKQGSDSICLGQRAYLEKLLERGGIADSKPCATPMEERLKM